MWNKVKNSEITPCFNDLNNIFEKDYKINSETKDTLHTIYERLHFITKLKLKIYYSRLQSFCFPTIKDSSNNDAYSKKGMVYVAYIIIALVILVILLVVMRVL